MAIKVCNGNKMSLCLCLTPILYFPNLSLELEDDTEVSASKCRSAVDKGVGAGTSVRPPPHVTML